MRGQMEVKFAVTVQPGQTTPRGNSQASTGVKPMHHQDRKLTLIQNHQLATNEELSGASSPRLAQAEAEIYDF